MRQPNATCRYNGPRSTPFVLPRRLEEELQVILQYALHSSRPTDALPSPRCRQNHPNRGVMTFEATTSSLLIRSGVIYF